MYKGASVYISNLKAMLHFFPFFFNLISFNLIFFRNFIFFNLNSTTCQFCSEPNIITAYMVIERAFNV